MSPPVSEGPTCAVSMLVPPVYEAGLVSPGQKPEIRRECGLIDIQKE